MSINDKVRTRSEADGVTAGKFQVVDSSYVLQDDEIERSMGFPRQSIFPDTGVAKEFACRLVIQLESVSSSHRLVISISSSGEKSSYSRRI
jgi:hypothetical protein